MLSRYDEKSSLKRDDALYCFFVMLNPVCSVMIYKQVFHFQKYPLPLIDVETPR